jgi:hypothetical protein
MTKLTLNEVLMAMDTNSMDIWDELDDEGRKSISLWLMNRYASSIEGKRESKELAVVRTNQLYNRNWASLGTKHAKLQWMILCTLNIGGDSKRHKWIGHKKSTNNELKNSIDFLRKHYPDMRDDELELLAQLTTKQQLREFAKQNGVDPREEKL